MRQSVPAPAGDDANTYLPCNVVLRALRDAAGMTQDGWATFIGYGRRTIQRWERGETAPDALAAGELLKLCGELGLFRSYQRGRLAGLTVTPESLLTLLADARLSSPRQQTLPPALRARDGATPLPIPVFPLPFEPPHNLPEDLTSFVGREAARAEVRRMLGSARLVSLTGTGGVGKTRLALRVAADLASMFPDGVWLVELAAINDPTLILHAVAEALGVRGQRGQALDETVAYSLRDQRVLLLLDNCEHLLDACATLTVRLLRSCPDLLVLATSREPLGVYGEIVCQVPPLDLPEPATEADLNALVDSEAIRLFVERAGLARAGFTLTPLNAAYIVEICRRLDGIPLAIELAAAWLRVLTPVEICERLNNRFRLLTSSARTGEARHQTLRAAIDWSYALLSSPERRLFDRLSIFAGPFSLATADAVCGDEDDEDILMLLTRLVEQSLVLSEQVNDGVETRFHMLETLRVYAGDRLRERGEVNALGSRLVERFIELCERAHAEIHGPHQGEWLRWAARNHSNVRAALDWAIEEENAAAALRIVLAVWWSWGVQGRGVEACRALERVLALSGALATDLAHLRADALAGLGSALVVQGDPATAQPSLDEAERLGSQFGNAPARLTARVAQTLIAVISGQGDAALRVDETLELARQLDDHWYEVRLIEMQAQCALRRGNADEATSRLEEGARIARRDQDAWGLAQVLGNLGDVARSRGLSAEAKAFYDESDALRRSIGIIGRSPSARQNLAFLALTDGDASAVRQRFVEAIREFQQRGDRRGMAECLIGFACLATISGHAAGAARLFGSGDAALESIGSQIWPSNQGAYELLLARTRSDMVAGEFAAAYAAGQAMSLGEAIAFALAQPHGLSAQATNADTLQD